MVLYSHLGQYPNSLPFRIAMPDGTTRTDPNTFTQEELQLAGYQQVEDPPALEQNQKLIWNQELASWQIEQLSEEELQQQVQLQLESIRQQRDRKIQDVSWRYERYARHARLGIPQIDYIEDLDNYIQSLCDITKNFPDPNLIVWPVLDANKKPLLPLEGSVL